MSRAPIQHRDAEAAVIGACFMEEEAFSVASSMLREEHFTDERHRAIWRALLELRGNGEEIDPLIAVECLTRRGELSQAGGKDYIAFLIDAVPTSANVGYHAAIVREYAERRELAALAERIAAEAREGKSKAKDIAAAASSELVRVAAVTAKRGFRKANEYVWGVMEAIEARAKGTAPPGIRTGYTAIDEHIGGFRGGDLIILAGVPGSGKTALGLNILINAASEYQDEGAMVSAEMTATALVERCLSNLALIDSTTLRRGSLDDDEWPRLARAGGTLAKLALHIDDTPRPAIDEVVARLRHLKAKHPALKLAVVDFIQLIRHPSEEMMALALTQISYELKGVAKELDIAIIATCQVDAAAVDKSETPRPHLHHLRWSQGMREAADFVGMVYRPKMYDPMAPDNMEVAWEKCRDLPTFVATLRWVGRYMRAENHPDHLTARAA